MLCHFEVQSSAWLALRVVLKPPHCKGSPYQQSFLWIPPHSYWQPFVFCLWLNTLEFHGNQLFIQMLGFHPLVNAWVISVMMNILPWAILPEQVFSSLSHLPSSTAVVWLAINADRSSTTLKNKMGWAGHGGIGLYSQHSRG